MTISGLIYICIGFLITYFIIKWAVKNGTKKAFEELLEDKKVLEQISKLFTVKE